MKQFFIAMTLLVAACQAADMEDNVVRLVEEGKVNEAQDQARKSGVSGKALIRLKGILFHAVGQADSAVAYLRQAHKDNPSDARITLRLAEALFWKRDLNDSRPLMEQVSDKAALSGSRPWEGGMHKAGLLTCFKDFDHAAGIYRMVLAERSAPEPVKLQARYHLAEIAAWSKEFPRAMSMLDSILRTVPGKVDATLLKGQIEEWQGQYAQARSTYTAGLQFHPTDALLRMRLEKLSWVK